jgi:acetyl esterase/lipase
MSTTTYVYKTVAGCALHADVYTQNDAFDRPVLVWLHGGALILGSRAMIDPTHLARYLDAGYTVAAVDYRLAPETKLPEIISDVQDAIAWVRADGPRPFGVDPQRLAVIGHSAGGYLTLLAGCTIQPRPQALVAFYGYGDIAGAWYSRPSPYYCRQPPVSEKEAFAVVGSDGRCQPPCISDGSAVAERSRFYLYTRQRGLWPLLVAGYDPERDRDALLAYCPVLHVTEDYPPTLLLHGDEDMDVPYEQSVAMAEALAAADVPHRLLTIPGGEHVFDARMTDPTVAAAFDEVLIFLSRYLRPAP